MGHRLVPLPRIIRFRDAPAYLGMDRNRFNAEVRPHVTEIPIGKQGVGFDRRPYFLSPAPLTERTTPRPAL